METGSRYASSPHNSQEECLCISRRKGIAILSPSRGESWRARVGLADFRSSDIRSELVNNERYSMSTVNKFRRPFDEADRQGEFRLASNEVSNPDDLIRSVLQKGHYRISSPSHHCNVEKDVCYNYFSPMREKAMDTDLELTEASKDNQFASMWDERMVLDGYGILLNKHTLLEAGTGRPIILLPPESSDQLNNPKSYNTDNVTWSNKLQSRPIGNADFGCTNSVGSQYGEESRLLKTDCSYKLQYTRPSDGQDNPQCSRSHEEAFEKEERDIFNYSRRTIYPSCLPHSKIPALAGDLSNLPRALSCGEHTSSLNACSENFSHTKLCEATLSERHRQMDSFNPYTKENSSGLHTGKHISSSHAQLEDFSNAKLCEAGLSLRQRQMDNLDRYSQENSSVLHIGDCSSNDIQLYSSRQAPGDVVAACTENIRRESFRTIPVLHDNCPQRQESWQCESLRPLLDVQANNCMENTTNLTKRFIGELKDVSVKNNPLDGHGDIHRSFSPRAISSALNGDPFGSRRSFLPSVSRTELSRNSPTRYGREEYSVGKSYFDMDSKLATMDLFRETIVDMHKSCLSPSSKSKLSIGGLDKYEYEKRDLKRKHIAEDHYRGRLQQWPSNDQSKPRKLQKMDLFENGWVDKEGTSSSIHSQRSFSDKVLHRNVNTISVPGNRSSDMHKNFSKSKTQSKFSTSQYRIKINCQHEDKSEYRNDVRDIHYPHKVDKEGTSSSINSRDKVLDRNLNRMSVSGNRSSDVQKSFLKSKPQSKASTSQNQMKINCQHEAESKYRNDEQDIDHPHNSQKCINERLKQDRLWNKYEENGQVDGRDPVQLSDMPEDSEKFKQKVQKAFLHFVKFLNENPGDRKRYEENGGYGSLFCIVCRSLSRSFATTHSLITHAFNCQKVELRVEHLGLHKALCVMMGWNYAVAPDNAYVYQSLAKADAIAMKDDLILWPPLVIIHMYAFKNKQDGCQVVTSSPEMDDILRGLGFEGGKSKAIDCGSASQGTFIVKFIPTYSGLQEAQRLHKYCEENNCGRNNWAELQSLQKSRQNFGRKLRQLQHKSHAENKMIFYGYIGIAEDLEKVDIDTRKRSLVKSRKDIEAIADCPVLGA